MENYKELVGTEGRDCVVFNDDTFTHGHPGVIVKVLGEGDDEGRDVEVRYASGNTSVASYKFVTLLSDNTP